MKVLISYKSVFFQKKMQAKNLDTKVKLLRNSASKIGT